ncbi:MAG: hypothetical protein WDA19_01370 [Mariniphaga sp.]
MPTADIQSGDRITRVKLRQSRGTLRVAIDVIEINWCHQGIVHVTEIMPHPVLLVDPHMAHLYRKKKLQHRLPDTPVVDIIRNAEH